MSIFLGLFPLLTVVNVWFLLLSHITNFSTHSARLGGATSAANSGIPERNFQRHGRWASVSAKNTYIKDSLASRLDVSKSLSRPFFYLYPGLGWPTHTYMNIVVLCIPVM